MPETILLIIFIVLIVFLFRFYFRDTGIYTGIRKSKENRERILLEDALKYIFDCEYKDIVCHIDDIAENLNIGEENAKDLLNKLKKMNLITEENNEILLTSQGKKYAIKIIRIHRIWERYLADETGTDEVEWHKKADKIEHFITPDKANAIASKIGNPVFDPHGDPIPNENGEIPVYKGGPLSDYVEGDNLIITHIEDEPDIIYKQLVEMGIFPGMEIFLLENDRDKIKIIIEGNERILINMIAKSITVVPLKKEIKKEKSERLSEVKVGETAIVTGISQSSRGLERRRFMDLGIVPGTEITPLLVSPGGDPVAYNILDTKIALRKKQAEKILVRCVRNKRTY